MRASSAVSLQLVGLINTLTNGSSASGRQIGLRLLAAASCDAASPPLLPPNPQLTPGTAFTLTKCFAADEVESWAALTGDSNPIHVDDAAAAAVGLAVPVLPGMLLAALFPAIIGSHFPGAVYLSQTLKFKQYAPVGHSYAATVTVEKASGSRVRFDTVCRDATTGAAVVEGTALALIKQQQQS
ncbi:3-hydroxybutyryl-CoA dehydratase [Chlorella vulgaris]